MTDEEKIEYKGNKHEGNWFSRQSTVVMVIIVLFAICCVGIIVFFAATAFLSPDGIQANDDHTDRVGSHDFKIPAGYEIFKTETSEINNADYFYYKDSKTGYVFAILEDYKDVTRSLEPVGLANILAMDSNSDPVEVTLNGETAYKVESFDSNPPVYLYSMNIDGKLYCIAVDT